MAEMTLQLQIVDQAIDALFNQDKETLSTLANDENAPEALKEIIESEATEGQIGFFLGVYAVNLKTLIGANTIIGSHPPYGPRGGHN